MTTDKFKLPEEVIISVIGIGEDSKKYIEEIKDWNSPLVSAMMLDRDFIVPEAGIEMAILLITENVDATILAKNLKQSGLLTLIIATCEIRAMEGSYDSMAMVSSEKVMETVKTAAEILYNPHNLLSNDTTGWWCELKDSETFQTFSFTSSYREGGMTNVVNYLKEKLKELPSLKKIMFSINISRAGLVTHGPEYFEILCEFLSKLEDSIKVLWGLDPNENMASDELAISVIATGISKYKE